MIAVERVKLIERLRRATRNSDILALCDEVERQAVLLDRQSHASPQAPQAQANRSNGFDKRSYQRELMRKRRAAQKAASGVTAA